MSVTRKVKFEYFRVVYRQQDDQGGVTDRLFDLRRLFDRVERLSLLARTYDYYQEQARLDRLYFNRDYGHWFLHFTRLRDTNLPSLATTDSEAEPIELEDDEYIGEDVSALYDENLYVLMLQRNRFSLSPSGIEKYLNLLWNSDTETIYLRPIIADNSIDRARNARYYRRLTVKFADVRNARINARSPLGRILGSFGEYNAIQGEITVNLCHVRGDTLSPETVRLSIDDVIENRDIIIKAELSKKDEDDTQMEVIDLFDDKMHDISYVSIERRRSLTHNDLGFKMYDLYRDKRQEIQEVILRIQNE